MSTVIVTIKGTPTPGDLLMLSYSSPTRGGQSTLMVKVRPPTDTIVEDASGNKTIQTTKQTIENLVDGFVDEFARGQQWPLPEFEVTKRNAESLVVKQQNAAGSFFDGIVFKGFVEGAGGAEPTETMELEVL